MSRAVDPNHIQTFTELEAIWVEAIERTIETLPDFELRQIPPEVQCFIASLLEVLFKKSYLVKMERNNGL